MHCESESDKSGTQMSNLPLQRPHCANDWIIFFLPFKQIHLSTLKTATNILYSICIIHNHHLWRDARVRCGGQIYEFDQVPVKFLAGARAGRAEVKIKALVWRKGDRQCGQCVQCRQNMLACTNDIYLMIEVSLVTNATCQHIGCVLDTVSVLVFNFVHI